MTSRSFSREQGNCLNKVANKVSAKYKKRCQVFWQLKEDMEKAKLHTNMVVSEYSSVVHEIENTDLMDRKYYIHINKNHTDIEISILFIDDCSIP